MRKKTELNVKTDPISIFFLCQTFSDLNLSADYNLTQGEMGGYFIE